jgi:outer membrane cobalamin receptor
MRHGPLPPSLFLLFVARAGYAQDGGIAPEDAGVGEDAETSAAAAPDATVAQDGESGRSPAAFAPPMATAGTDVVVTATRSSSRDRSKDSTTIPGDRLRSGAPSTVFEALSRESADVYVPSRGIGIHGVGNGATGGIRIRGLGGSPNSQILVVEDDVPDYQGIFGHPIPDAYVPHLIDEVVVIKGGDSTLYGTNAMGGVVVLRSRWLDRDEDGYELVSDAGFGSYSTMRQAVSLLGRQGSWDVASGLTSLKTDGHRPGTAGGDQVGSLALRYRWTPRLFVTVRDKIVHLQGGDPGPVSTPTIDHWVDVWRNTTAVQVGFSDRAIRLSITPYLNLGVHRLYDGFYSRDYVGGAVGELRLQVHRSVAVIAGLAAEHVAGMVENRITGDRPDVGALTDASLYQQVTVKPARGISLVGGARWLQSSRYGSVPLYKAGARWDLGRGLFLRSNFSRNFRQPTLRELYLPYPTANPNLKAEYAQSADVGVGYLSGHVDVGCSGYRTEARDLIKYFGVWPAAEVVNIGHLTIYGVEGHVAVKHLGPLSAWVSASWQDVGRYTRQNPNAKIDFRLEASQAFTHDLVTATLTGEWVHGLYMADYARQPIPNVFVMDLAVRYRHMAAQRRAVVEPYLLVRNFLDRQYAYVAGYTMPGCNVMLGLKVEI